jgi:peroxiredoxin
MKLPCFLSLSLLLLSSTVAINAIQVGDAIPDQVELHLGFPPANINVKERVAGKKVIIVGLPGAFTPT